jgi:hypothetical protein
MVLERSATASYTKWMFNAFECFEYAVPHNLLKSLVLVFKSPTGFEPVTLLYVTGNLRNLSKLIYPRQD